MQKIFTQQIRFGDLDGGKFQKWNSVKFGEVYTFKSNNSYSRENLNYEYGTIKNIHYGDIHTKFNTLFDITNEVVPYINPSINTDKIDPENFCKEGDLIFADASEDYADVGKCIELVNLNNEKVVSGLHTILARPTSGILFSGFGGYMMKSSNVRMQIQKIAQGTKVLGISPKRLANLNLSIPCIEEQRKIVELLSLIQEKISFSVNQIQKIEDYKKQLTLTVTA